MDDKQKPDGIVLTEAQKKRRREGSAALRATRRLFAFSILYLFALFATLLLEVVVRGVMALIG